MSSPFESAESVAGVTRFASAPSYPRPHLVVVGAIHGDERCGLAALTRLRDELATGALTLRAGTLTLVHGNPAATDHGRRCTPTGVDLNRLFDYRFVDELPRALWQPEHHRALALRPVLEEADAVVDLHSTGAPTPPFVIASRVAASEPLALALGLEYVTLGWDGPAMLGEQVLLAVLTRRERPGVAVECGQHEAPGAPEIAYRCAKRALSYFGMIEAAADAPEAHKRLWVRAAIKRPSASFRFAEPLEGMQHLAAGHVIGYGDQLVLSVRSPCYAIMPNDTVPVGDDMLYIAEEQE